MSKFINLLTVLSLVGVCYVQHNINAASNERMIELSRLLTKIELQNNYIKNNTDRYELEVAEAYEVISQKVEAILVILGMQ